MRRRHIAFLTVLTLAVTLASLVTYQQAWGAGPAPIETASVSLGFNASVNRTTTVINPSLATCTTFQSRGLGIDATVLLNYTVPKNLTPNLTVRTVAVVTASSSAPVVLTATNEATLNSSTSSSLPGSFRACITLTATLENQTSLSQATEIFEWYAYNYSVNSYSESIVVSTDPLLLESLPIAAGLCTVALGVWCLFKREPPQGPFSAWRLGSSPAQYVR